MSSRIVSIATATGAEVENTTTRSSFAKETFPAGSLRVGKIYDFECGIKVVDTNSTDTLKIGLTFGPTSATLPASNTSIAEGGAVDVADNDVGYVRGSIHVLSATSAVFHVEIADPDAVGTITMDNHGPVAFTLDPEVANYLDVTGEWSVAHADNEAAALSFAVTERT